jgi:hypothetical protein
MHFYFMLRCVLQQMLIDPISEADHWSSNSLCGSSCAKAQVTFTPFATFLLTSFPDSVEYFPLTFFEKAGISHPSF